MFEKTGRLRKLQLLENRVTVLKPRLNIKLKSRCQKGTKNTLEHLKGRQQFGNCPVTYLEKDYKIVQVSLLF